MLLVRRSWFIGPDRANASLTLPLALGPSSCTFFFSEPRATPEARLALGAAFLRAARFTFLRSALSVMVFVFILVRCSILLDSCVFFHQLLQTVAGKAYRELSILAIAFATQHRSRPYLGCRIIAPARKPRVRPAAGRACGAGDWRFRDWRRGVVGCWRLLAGSRLLAPRSGEELLDVLHRVVRLAGVEIALGRFAHFVSFGVKIHLRRDAAAPGRGPRPTLAELRAGIARGWWPPAGRRRSAADSAPRSGTAASPRASCRRSTAAALLPSRPSNRASGCAGTGLLPCPPGTRSETPDPWRCAASAARPARARPVRRHRRPAPRDPEIRAMVSPRSAASAAAFTSSFRLPRRDSASGSLSASSILA